MILGGQVVSVIGIDPGETVGISFLDYVGNRLTGTMQVQVDAASSVALLEALLKSYYGSPEAVKQRWGAVEDFVVSNRPETKGDAAATTRHQAFILAETLQMWGYHVSKRKKADVSPWATDKMLSAAGRLREPTGTGRATAA